MEFDMKTEEDEAFDDLARKQGDWGGGFPAKRAMAKARIEEDDDIQDYKRPWVGLTLDEIEELFQSAAGADEETDIRFARLIEAKLKEKNT
jgi:hypothetical protein